jgi:hypothetical protein
MTPDEARHLEFTGIRAKAYDESFGDKPVAVFPSYKLRGEAILRIGPPHGTSDRPSNGGVDNKKGRLLLY